jgi:hypothetical protein
MTGTGSQYFHSNIESGSTFQSEGSLTRYYICQSSTEVNSDDVAFYSLDGTTVEYLWIPAISPGNTPRAYYIHTCYTSSFDIDYNASGITVTSSSISGDCVDDAGVGSAGLC